MMRFSIAFLALSMGLVLASATGCKSGGQPVLLENLNYPQQAGYYVYQDHCIACHYDRRTGSFHGPSLLGIFRKPSLPSGAPANDERVTAVILNGHNLMPAAGKALTPVEISNLLAYLHTL